MNESQWHSCQDPERMLRFLLGAPSGFLEQMLRWLGGSPLYAPKRRWLPAHERKYLLYVSACWRSIETLMEDNDLCRAFEMVELFTQDLVETEQMISVMEDIRGHIHAHFPSPDFWMQIKQGKAKTFESHMWLWTVLVGGPPEGIDGHMCCAALPGASPVDRLAALRDIFGNPFRPVRIDPAWLAWNDGTVVKLAQTIYEERTSPSGHLDTGRMSITADALEEAGCQDAELLGHLRGPGPHMCGCHVLDALLGKE